MLGRWKSTKSLAGYHGAWRELEAIMSGRIRIRGTVNADGKLELDHKIAMPAGRVVVTLRPALQPAPSDPFWGLMGRIWDGHGAAAFHPRRNRERIPRLNH